jgi:hypothetical protein
MSKLFIKVRLHTTINRADSALSKRYLKNMLSTSSDNIVNQLTTFAINIWENLKSA